MTVRDEQGKPKPKAKGRGGSRDLLLAIAMALGVLLLSGVINLGQTALQSELRFSVSELQAQCHKLDQEIATLSLQLAPLTALTAIEVRASKAGLGPPKRIEYLEVPAFVPASVQPSR